MKLTRSSSRIGTYRLVSALVALTIAGISAHAETVLTVNGATIDSNVLEFYIQSRTNRPAAQATAEERDTLTKELTDIYILATQEEAERLAQNPRISAQLELQRRGILAQAVANEFFANSTVTDEEIATEYAEQVKVAPTEQFKARHILVGTQAEALEIINELNNGADFIELAKSKSTGPSGPNGGDLGWFSPNQMVPEFSAAVQKLSDGSYTKEPVQTQYGWHVIMREASRQSEAPPLESSKPQITQAIKNRKFQEHLAKLRAEAKM